MSLHLDYFYGTEEKQYHFFRFPKLLFTDLHYKTIPTEAKVLYSLLLDRMTLSMRNGWLDEQGRVFLYFSLEEAMEQLNCGKDKAIRLFKALDVATGIGLIERHKQGQGRPTKIYIKNFMPAGQQPPAQATLGQSVLMPCEQTVTAQRTHTSSETAQPACTPPIPCKQIATEQHVYIPPLSAPRKQAAMPRKRVSFTRRRIPPTPSMLRAMAEQSAVQTTSAQPVSPSFVPPIPKSAALSQPEGQKAGMTTQEELLRQIAENQKKNMALLLEKLGFLTSVNPQSGLAKPAVLIAVNPVFQTSGKPTLIILKRMIRKRIKLRK